MRRIEKEAIERARFDPIELGRVMRELDSIRRSNGRGADYESDLRESMSARLSADQELADLKSEIFMAMIRFLQKHGIALARAEYIKTDNGTLSFHEDLSVALTGADFFWSEDRSRILIDEERLIGALDL